MSFWLRGGKEWSLRLKTTVSTHLWSGKNQKTSLHRGGKRKRGKGREIKSEGEEGNPDHDINDNCSYQYRDCMIRIDLLQPVGHATKHNNDVITLA